MHIPLVYEHLFYKYFVRRSVGQATKGERASLLMDVVILVWRSSTVLLPYLYFKSRMLNMNENSSTQIFFRLYRIKLIQHTVFQFKINGVIFTLFSSLQIHNTLPFKNLYSIQKIFQNRISINTKKEKNDKWL